jgi:hypothetical protein
MLTDLALPVGEGRGVGFCPQAEVAQLPELFEGSVFDDGFVEVGHAMERSFDIRMPGVSI